MREIKFRAWVNNKMAYVEYPAVITYGYNGLIHWENGVGHSTSIDAVFMQYTGLKDKNRKEIYEGDAISFKAHAGYLISSFIAKVVWYESGWAYVKLNADEIFPDIPTYFSSHDELEKDFLNHCEIVGYSWD